MKPSTVFGLTCLLAASMLIVYNFFLPHILRDNQSAKNNSGYWGVPTAEFDWCEANYIWTQVMAEPWNTFTGISYIFVGAAAIPYYLRVNHAFNVDMSIYVYGAFTMLPLGVATSVFHATLLYPHQLLDKITMHALVSAGFINMWTRCDPGSWLHHLSKAQTVTLGLIFWLSRSDRDGILHQGARATWLFTFSCMFFYILYAGSVMSRECGKLIGSKSIERLFDQCYTIWMVSIIGWILDNVLCDLLQIQLGKFHVPYLNFHGTLWHLGSCLGIYYISQVMIAYGMIVFEKRTVEVRTFCWVFPYIAITDSKKDN